MHFLGTFWELVAKGGEKYIDHRLRERVFAFYSLLFWWLNFVCFRLFEILYFLCDTWMIMCLIICYINACWMTLSFYLYMIIHFAW